MSDPATANDQSVRLSQGQTRAAEAKLKLKLLRDPESGGLVLQLRGDHSDLDANTELERMLGVGAEGFRDGLIKQIGWGCQRAGEVDLDAANFVLSVVVGAQPRDQFEAMLAMQMGLVQVHAARQSKALMNAEMIVQNDSARNGLTKLCRTYTAQLEALKRYRTGGEQKVTVEHVTVNAGGRAVVGAVAIAKGGGGETKEQAHAKQIVDAPEPALRGADAERDAVSVAGDAERSMSDARWKITGRTDR